VEEVLGGTDAILRDRGCDGVEDAVLRSGRCRRLLAARISPVSSS
jgi:hypothetical protein